MGSELEISLVQQSRIRSTHFGVASRPLRGAEKGDRLGWVLRARRAAPGKESSLGTSQKEAGFGSARNVAFRSSRAMVSEPEPWVKHKLFLSFFSPGDIIRAILQKL